MEEDNFDFYEGAKLALERLEEKTRKLKEGDVVKVTNPGKAYDILPAFYFDTDDELRCYAFRRAPEVGQILFIKRIGKDGKIYAWERRYNPAALYVIGPEGVERVKK